MRKALIMLSILCFAALSFGQELSASKITALSGAAEVAKFNENKNLDWVPAQLNQVLSQGDEVRTREGRLELTFDDGSRINLKENTSLSLVQLPPKNNKGNTLVKIWIGKIRAKFSVQKEDSTFQVQSRNIVAAVKGTEFIFDSDLYGGFLQVVDGIVSLFDPLNKKEIFVKAGEKASYAGAFEGKPEEMGKEEKERLEEDWSGKKEEPKKEEEKKTPEAMVENPANAGSAGDNFNGTFGAVSIDGKTYYMMSLFYELTLGKFGAGFDVRLLWDDSGIKEDEWRDWQRSVQNMFKYVRYGVKGEPLYIKLGVLDNSTIGHGFLVRRYSNIGIDLYKRTFGLELDIKQGMVGVEGLTNDILDRRLYAGRLYVDLIPNFLQAGLSGAYDFNPADNKFIGVSTVPMPDANAFVEYGADLGIALIKTGLLDVLLYADYGKIRDGGEGFAMPGVMGKIAIFDYQFEYRSLESNFVAGLFDNVYEDKRPLTLPAAGGPRLKGVFGQIGANIFKWLNVVAAYQQYEGSKPYVRGEACYKGKLIPKISEVAIGYEQKDIDVVSLKSPNTVAYARVGMEMAPGMVFLFTMRQTYDTPTDSFKRSTMMTMQMRF